MIKIGFVSEYFPPFTPGGAEWSTYYLAKDLSKRKDIKIIVLTPNYGADKYEQDQQLEIIRFPFYRKIKKINDKLSEFEHSNPIWVFWQTWNILKNFKNSDLDLIHVQGKYSLVATYLANLVLRKKLFATIRDYQVICNYGFCIYNKDKSCSLSEYFLNDLPYYWKNYVEKKDLPAFICNFGFALWGRFNCLVIRFFAKKYNVVVLSKKQGAIFKANGFKKIEVINNSIQFPEELTKNVRKDRILFAGRLTPGKGINLLMEMLPIFFEKYPKYTFIFAGNGQLKDKLLALSDKYRQIKVLGSVTHADLLKLYSESKLTIVPSIWQEPFGRIALESLSRGTPTIVTNRGGLPEIIIDGRWGYVVNPDCDSILKAIDIGISQNKRLLRNIKTDFSKIKNKFGTNIIEKYMELYQQ